MATFADEIETFKEKKSDMMTKRRCFMLMLMSMMVLGVWADGASSFSGGDGTEKNPYLIKSSADWNQLATDVNGGKSYNGEYFKLDADFTVTQMLGAGTSIRDAKPFSGKFDGGGHTLIFNHTATAEEGSVAPFRFIKRATISNLHVEGQITTAYKLAGGLVGRTCGASRIQNCRVSTVINSSVGGDGTHGGIVALKLDDKNANLTIEGCVFDGKIVSTGTVTTRCGGFVGFTSKGTLNIRNSIYAPVDPVSGSETAVSNESNTLCRYTQDYSDHINVTNCYYFQTLGTAQGKQARSIGFDDGVDINVVPTGTATDYGVSGITAYDNNQCVKYNDVVYAGSGDAVKLTFSHNYAGVTVSGYNVKSNNVTEWAGNGNGGYTFTMGDTDVILGYTAMTGDRPEIVGSGTSANPYQISTSREWDYFVSLISNGQKDANNDDKEYAYAHYRLSNDITVTTMMGSASHRFGGHFDGYGHTLTVSYNTDEQYAAPFRYVDGAEISNLRVAGTIRTSKKFAGGFIANVNNSVTETMLTNCRSSVTINSSVEGDGTHGGFVAHIMGGTLRLTGCAFDGYMLGGKTNNCAGFVGWNETNNNANGKVYITNSLFAPKGTQQVIDKVFARSRSYAEGVITITNSHCTADYSVAQQSRVYSVIAGENVSLTYSGTNPSSYSVSGLTTYDVGLTFDGVLYAKENAQLTLNLTLVTQPSIYVFSGFASTAGTLSGESNPYTFKQANANATIYATYTGSPTWSGSGSGTQSDPYIISTIDQWNEFVNKVNTGIKNTNNVPFNTAYYKLELDDKLDDNITVTTMVGTDGYKFKGHFDGNGKTLTLNYGSAESPFSENYCAPFRYIEGADISNLHVDGTIYTNKQFAAGIAGYVLNNNTITDCRSSVVINSSVNGDGTHGGFVANCQNSYETGTTTVCFTRCVFDGQLLGANTNNCGGFVGWEEANCGADVNFDDCIFAPSEVNVSNDGSATFSRGQSGIRNGITVSNCYYTQSLGTMQGEMAYTTLPADVTTEALTIAGITVYVKKTVVDNVAATDITPNQATISWTGTEACSNYQVRYRVKQDPDVYSTSFEEGLPEGWTTLDNDNDGYGWTDDDTNYTMPHSGDGCMYSASYINNYGPLEPDNWLVTKQLTLGGTMKVWLKGQDEDDYQEHFAIYLSTLNNSNIKDNFLDGNGKLLSSVVTLVPETETAHEYQEYTVDLSAYSGQGYIAIRHFNCYNQYKLVLDDFSLYKDNSVEWTTASGALPAGTTLTGLTPGTTYEYQVGFDYGGKTFYTSTATLTTLADNVAPFDLSATATSNAATISWTGFGDSYNLRYGQWLKAKVTLSVPNDVWEDGTGYQMLLDANHNTYGDVIPEKGGLTTEGGAPAETYAIFEYKIPSNADGAMNTKNVIDGSEDNKSVTITIPAGIYDWCITNPSPDDRVWIASAYGTISGRQDDFVFEAGKHYTFTVSYDEDSGNDRVDMTVVVDADLAQGTVTNLTGITGTTYTMSGLTASTDYTFYVQSVKGDKTSEWSSIGFNTTDATSIGLLDAGDNSAVIEANKNQQSNVTLQGRTLTKDGNWNTLCLPFSLTNEQIADSPLAGATIKELKTSESNLDGKGTLTLKFTTVYDPTDAPSGSITAGKPYIVKWASGDPISNPVFNDVTITSTTPTAVTSDDGKVTFVGQYSPFSIVANDAVLSENQGHLNEIIMLASGNKLGYSKNTRTLKCFRCHFYVKADGTTQSARAFVMDFGDDLDDATRLNDSGKMINDNEGGAWYSLDGRKLDGNPKAKGMYIRNGKKVIIK